MGMFFKDIKTMEDLFLHQLEDIYYAENQIIKSLPKMIDLATNQFNKIDPERANEPHVLAVGRELKRACVELTRKR